MEVRNIALLGHKDHGKSTLIGSLLMQTGAATKVRMMEAEAYSKKLHRPFEPAFILDSFSEERVRGMTYDTTRAEIKYRSAALALIDVPGHEELIKNMISGASYGELALLLVSAMGGEGVMAQTKRHVFIAKMLGMESIVVAVNKMDTVNYGEEVFQRIKSQMTAFLKAIGYKEANIAFVPISAYRTENLVARSTLMDWYHGGSLLETAYGMLSRARKPARGQLRLLMQGCIETGSGTFSSGRILQGNVRVGQVLRSTMDRGRHSVSKIFVKGTRVKTAIAGENVAIRLGDGLRLPRGAVLYGANESLRARRRMLTLIFATRRIGQQARIRFIGNEYKARFKILDIIDPTTGKTLRNGTLAPLRAADAEMEVDAPIPAGKPAELSRFTIYSGKEFSGIGIVNG